MKKLLIIGLCLLASTAMLAQNDNYGRISINVVLPDNLNIPVEAQQNLETKMQQFVTQYGLADNGLDDRFVMTAKVNVINKDIASSTPVKISQKIEVTFIVGDIVENKIYETATITVAGIGMSETKSFIQAFQQIKVNHPSIKRLMETAQQKIASYYANNCSTYITQAKTMGQQQMYNQALSLLLAVPNVCNECFEQCQTLAVEIYGKKIDNEGKILIQKARNAWIVKKDYSCAGEALNILSGINPQASCIVEAEKLVEEINCTLRKIEEQKAAEQKAAWEFKMQQYADNLQDRRKAQADRVGLIKEAIAGMTKVGIAYGNHQPQQIIRYW